MIRRIAILTGDDHAPGMNVVIRAVTRAALDCGWEVMGVCDGDSDLAAPAFIPLSARTVDELIQWGSTILGSSRQFSNPTAQKSTLDQLAARDIDALVVVGGYETQASAHALSQLGFPVNGIAASVEDDLAGFNMTIGVDSAMNVLLGHVDDLRLAHLEAGTTFVVEVAGRRCGYLALMSGIAGNADLIVIPELETTTEQMAAVIRAAIEEGKAYTVIIIAEGATHNVERVKRYFEENTSPRQKIHVTRLAYLQRRASPSAADRLLALRLGACAVEALARGEYGVLAGSSQGVMRTIPLGEALGRANELDAELIHLANILSFSNFVMTQTH